MSYRCHIDFETRSICDLRTRGDQMYAQHFSTAPIMLAFISPHAKGVFDFMQDKRYANSLYPVHEEFGEYLNSYAVPLPTIIRKAIDDDAIFVAHNARFEQSIYYWICHRRWGWPMPRRWSCTAARARYWGLRASLYGVGEDLEIENKKLATEGADFIKTFCIPRQYRGAKKNGNIATLWAEPDELPNEWKKGVEYCLVDAEAEKEVDGILPDLPPFEQAVWDLDFKMNTRGLPIDVENVYKAMAFSEHYTQVGQIRFNAITGGLNPTQRDRVLEYVNAREETLDLPNLRTKTLQRVSQVDLSDDLKDIIHLRLEAARASVKKLEAMKNGVSDDGFARGLFLYYGAHTGRFTAKRIQPHNYVRGDPVNSRIMFDYLADPCWTKGLDNQGVPQWVRLGDLLFPRPLGVLSKAMRGFIKAPDGKRFVIGDYAQIEARVLAWLARASSQLASFKAGEDVYVRFAADHMYSRPYDSYFDSDGKVRPEYKFERQVAKSAVLGCFKGDTKVLTDSGWKYIVDITLDDMLWDGVEWVSHKGVIYQGIKDTIEWNGLTATPCHEILTEHGWKEWNAVHTSHSLFQSALDMVNLPFSGGSVFLKEMVNPEDIIPYVAALAGGKGSYPAAPLKVEPAQDAKIVLSAKVNSHALKLMDTRMLSPKSLTGIDCLREYLRAYPDAITPITHNMKTTVDAVSMSMSLGYMTEARSYSSCETGYSDGTTPTLNSTALTITEGMNPETFNSAHVGRITPIDDRSKKCSERFPVYDIALAGPRNRYTVATDAGPIIAHNCGFGLGAEGFRAYCDASDVLLTEEEADKVVRVYRAAVPEIADYRDGLWKRVGLCAIMATENEREEYKLWGTDISFKVHRLSADRYWLVVTLPSGRHIAYYRPKLDTVDRWNRPQLSFRTEWNGKTYREQTYGGRLTENIVQAVARDICMQGALNAEDMGFTMIGTVHDELLTLVNHDANVGPDQLKAAMLDRQDWYTDLPMNGEALFMDRYGSH